VNSLTRFLGTELNGISLFLEYLYWPENFPWLDDPFGLWLIVAHIIADLMYMAVLLYFQRKEKREAAESNGKAKTR